MSTAGVDKRSADITVGLLQENELPEADRIFRLAFGTFIGLPEPEEFHKGGDYIRTRWITDPNAFFAAHDQERLIGSNFGTNWGSVGFFGPLTIRPDYWDQGVGKRLMEPIMELFARWSTRHAGLFTFAHSAKHVGLYQRFGFMPRYLTAIMARPVQPGGASEAVLFSSHSLEQQQEALKEGRDLTSRIYEGLDVSQEIRAVAAQNLGDTLLIWEGSELEALAVCHCGEGTEAGPDTCYVKFAAVRPGASEPKTFTKLLSACESLAAERGMNKLVAGVSTAREEAYREMLVSGFRTLRQGVSMHKASDAGYSRAGIYVLDDWR